eukprot:Hpha_TRINITY_DN15651_c5_g3::TRINITY_DN15651_c5_g3_i3::g.100537::m.100537/K10141/SESN1_3; sestrin 1/3
MQRKQKPQETVQENGAGVEQMLVEPYPVSHMRPIGHDTHSCSGSSFGENALGVICNGLPSCTEEANTPGGDCTDLYRRLLVEKEELRRERVTVVIANLQQMAQVAVVGGVEGMYTFVSQHGPLIVDYAACPLGDVSTAFRRLLEWLESLFGFDIESIYQGSSAVSGEEESAVRDASLFVPDSELVPLQSGGDSQELFRFVFLDQGQVPHWVRVLGAQPRQSLALYKAWTSTLGSGPLPVHFRCYVVAMAAAVHRCEYWMKRGEHGFLAAGGDSSWLDLGAAACPKLHHFCPVLLLLAHKPWALTSEHISDVLQSGEWTISELVHAMTIAASTLAHCAFARGLGLTMEQTSAPLIGGNQELLHCSTRRGSSPGVSSTSFLVLAANRIEDEAEMELEGGLEGGDTPPEADTRMLRDGTFRLRDEEEEEEEETRKRYERLCPNDEGVTFNTARMDESLQVSEFNWRDDAAALIEQLLPPAASSPSVAELLDHEFSLLGQTTLAYSSSLGPEGENLPRLIFLYVSQLYAVLANDTKNKLHNKLNTSMGVEAVKALKCFVRDLAAPGATRSDTPAELYAFDESVGWEQPTVSHADKARIALLVAGARKQATLVHAMRAVSKYLATRR